MVLSSVAAAQTSLQSYAAQCDAAIGATVPAFSCSSGALIPTTNHVGGSCDRPNRLKEECDPGSFFQVLPSQNPAVKIVALCRRDGSITGFNDIAVIQTNVSSGATCFYQALSRNMPNEVGAPSQSTNFPWLPPSEVARIECHTCHDNGAIIRSPYLTQLTGPNALPGAGDNSFNKNQPYSFVGQDFASWRTFKVTTANTTCTNCHRMNTNDAVRNSRNKHGAALDFGVRATDVTERSKNPHGPSSPIWMMPGQVQFSQASLDAALSIRNCADTAMTAWRTGGALPQTAACTVQQVTGTQQSAAYEASSLAQMQLIHWRYQLGTGAPPTEYASSDASRILNVWQLEKYLLPFSREADRAFSAVLLQPFGGPYGVVFVNGHTLDSASVLSGLDFVVILPALVGSLM